MKEPPYQLPDKQWFKFLRASCDDPSLGLPSFPPEDLQRRWIGSAGADSLGEVERFYAHIKSKVDLSNIGRVLDFGSGYGRMSRAFLNDLDPSSIAGVDTDAAILKLCKETGVPGDYRLITPTGNLPFPDEHFGLVYAYSVFTHLPENLSDHWLKEIRRVLKPGGTLVATVEPPRVFEHFAKMDITDETLHPWLSGNAKQIQGNPAIRASFDGRGFAYYGGEFYGDTFMSPSYVRSRWGEYFTVNEYLDDRSRFFQAVVTAVHPQRRSWLAGLLSRLHPKT